MKELGEGCGSIVLMVAIVVLVLLFGIAFSWGMGWFATPFRVTSVENVQSQWQFAYDYDAALKASARNVCTAEEAVKNEPNPDLRSQRESQRIAQLNNYNRIEAEYDGRLRDAFRAKLVKPPDVPEQAPTLQQERVAVGC